MATGEAHLDIPKLKTLGLDEIAYGRELSKSLFGDQSIRTRFAEVLKATAALDDGLRLRLFIGPTAPELQTLRWERLRNPENDAPLFTKERVQFSRYLSSRDWRPVQMRTRTSLRALVAIANPLDLEEKGLPPIRPELELGLPRRVSRAPRLKSSRLVGKPRSRTSSRSSAAAATTSCIWCVTGFSTRSAAGPRSISRPPRGRPSSSTVPSSRDGWKSSRRDRD